MQTIFPAVVCDLYLLLSVWQVEKTMEKFVSTIKTKYIERRVNRETQWPPCHSDKLVKLELVERERGGKVLNRISIEYSDLFTEKDSKKVRKILVQGDAGIGKTTLCTALSEGWASRNRLQQFELLLYLPLRHKEIASAGSLSDLLKLLHSSARVRESVVRYIEEDEGEKVLIIADGWDEVDKGQDDKSFLLDLLSGKIFSLVSILLTSRPSASVPFKESFDQFVDVVGFSKENIEAFIQSELSSDGQEVIQSLLEQLENNPLVESVCSIPLHCAILCHLWRIVDFKVALPTTMTELFTKIILNVVLRNIGRLGAYNNLSRLCSFDDLPDTLHKPWQLLCKFAFHKLEKRLLVFPEAILASYFPDHEDSPSPLCFGVLQSSRIVYETGCGISFNFLHLTIQEYLAALHLVRQPLDFQLKVFQSHTQCCNSPSSSSSGISDMVLRFFFGVLFSKQTVECSSIDSIMRYATGMHMSDLERVTSFGFPQPLHLCHCAFEAKDKDVTSKVIQYLIESNICFNFSSLPILDQPRSAHDCAAVLYIISNMQECEDMVIDFGSSGVRVKQLEALARMLASRLGKIQVTSLNLQGNKLSDETMSNVFNTASVAFRLEELDLSDNKIGDNSVTAFTAALAKSRCNSLSRLAFSHNCLSVSSLQILEGTIRDGLLANLESLHLQRSLSETSGTLSAVALSSGSKEKAAKTPFDSFLEALSDHCPKLDIVDLSDNEFQVGALGAVALAKIASRSQNLKLQLQPWTLFSLRRCPYQVEGQEINLNATDLGDEGLIAFIESLEGACHLYALGLTCNNISATGISCLASSICSGKIFFRSSPDSDAYSSDFDTVGLHLDHNPLGLQGTEAICKILESSHCHLKILSLASCQLTRVTTNDCVRVHDLGKHLRQISPCYSITHLYLDGNSFEGSCIDILFGFMSLCPRLTILSSSQCELSSDDLKQLLLKLDEIEQVLPQSLFPLLLSWDLSDNIIGDSGVSAVLDHLPSLTTCSALGCNKSTLTTIQPAVKWLQN